MKTQNLKGFTLIEAMLAVVLLSILATMAYPSFNTTLERNRANTASSEILKALSYARSEAISRNRFIGVCPKSGSNTQACGAKDDWSNGLLVFEDKDNDNQFNPDIDLILQEYYLKQPVNITVGDKTRFIWQAGGLKLKAINNEGKETIVNGTIKIIPVEKGVAYNRDYRECTIADSGRVFCSWARGG